MQEDNKTVIQENQPAINEEAIAPASTDTEAPVEPKDDQTFRLKYMGEELIVGRDEVIRLAQKGMDYDRIRARADELAAQARPSLPTVPTTPEPAPDPADARCKREVAAFLSEYPGVDPASIPAEVWTAVRDGQPLVAAYRRVENQRLRARLEALQKQYENAARSAGSRATSGGHNARSAIDNDWYSD